MKRRNELLLEIPKLQLVVHCANHVLLSDVGHSTCDNFLPSIRERSSAHLNRSAIIIEPLTRLVSFILACHKRSGLGAWFAAQLPILHALANRRKVDWVRDGVVSFDGELPMDHLVLAASSGIVIAVQVVFEILWVGDDVG